MRPKSLALFETIKPRPNRRGFLLPDFQSCGWPEQTWKTDSVRKAQARRTRPDSLGKMAAATLPEHLTDGPGLASSLVLKACCNASHVDRCRPILWQIATFHPARGGEFALGLKKEFRVFSVAFEG